MGDAKGKNSKYEAIAYRVKEWEVVVDHGGEGMAVQLETHGNKNSHLTIMEIKSGKALDAYNQKNTSTAVQVKDKIASVNGKTGNGHILLKELTDSKPKGSYTLRVQRWGD